MNLKKSDKIVAVLGVVILIVAAVGVLFLMESEDSDDKNGGKKKTEGYTVEWTKDSDDKTVEETVAKGSPLEDSFTVSAPGGIVTSVNVQVSWNDQKTRLFGMLGKDQVTVTITPQDGGEEKTVSGKGMGNETLSFSVNSAPSAEALDVEGIEEAREIVETSYPISESVGFDYTINVAKGRLSILDNLFDKSELVNMKITYDTYTYEIIEPGQELVEENDDMDDDEPTDDQDKSTAELVKHMSSGLGTFY